MLSDVVYLGSVFGENKWSVIRRAGFVVLPSFTENFGVVIAESMAAGVPIITTNQTPWSVLNSSESGAWVPINEFEPKLREFLEFDQRKLDEMGVRARNVIEKEYSWKKRARQFYDDIYFPLIKAD
jgi:glycosyltransferase involved in cell wall biosynthesis